jgi:hypothetical protein
LSFLNFFNGKIDGMAHEIPGAGEEEHGAIGSVVIRGTIKELVTLDFRAFIEGTIGNLFGISRGLFLTSVFFGLLAALWHLIPNLPLFIFAWVVGTAPIWVPVLAVAGGWKAWLWYVRSRFLASKKGVLLEVKMPRELVKSPRGMDVALSHLWVQSGETTFYHRMWLGQVYPIFSMEICSFGGEVHFYFWTWPQWRSNVEAAIYAQYPEVEIVEAEDYASKYVYDPAKETVYCTDHRYEPRNDAYPLRTYVDFELDKDPKEEYKVDPLGTVVEFLSSMRPGEQIWLQIVFTPKKDTRRKKGGKFWETEDVYSSLIKEEIDTIRKQTTAANPNDREAKDSWKSFARVQMYRQTELIRTMDRQYGKFAYATSVRGVYIAPPEMFGSHGWFQMRFAFRPFGNPQYANQLRPRRWHTPFDYPYQDLWDIRWDLHARRFFDCYRRRNSFYGKWILPYNMMSTEVLASIWHPLSSAVKSPGLDRIPSKKASPPPNLPK